MTKKTIQRRIEAHGFVFTDVGAVRISAHGPRFPSTAGRAGERPTIVRVTGDGGRVLDESRHPNQASGARAFVRRVEVAGDVQAYIDAYNAGRITSEEECAAFARQRGYDSLEAFRTATDAYRVDILQGVGVTSN